MQETVCELSFNPTHDAGPTFRDAETGPAAEQQGLAQVRRNSGLRLKKHSLPRTVPLHNNLAWLLFVLAPLPPLSADEPATPALFAAHVERIVDGDSLLVRRGGQLISIRLEGIDAPELLQVFGAASRGELVKQLPRDTPVIVESVMKDKYGRLLARVYSSRVPRGSLSFWAVEQGTAWHFGKYNRDRRLAKAQSAAQENQRGLWRFSQPNAPWLFRIQVDRGEVMPDDRHPVHPPSDEFLKSLKTSRRVHWLNTNTEERHRIDCRRCAYDKGRPCTASEGTPCALCRPDAKPRDTRDPRSEKVKSSSAS